MTILLRLEDLCSLANLKTGWLSVLLSSFSAKSTSHCDLKQCWNIVQTACVCEVASNNAVPGNGFTVALHFSTAAGAEICIQA